MSATKQIFFTLLLMVFVFFVIQKREQVDFFKHIILISTSSLGHVGLYDTVKGRFITLQHYDDITNFDSSVGLAAVKSENQWQFINTEGEVISNLKFDWIGEWSNGLIAVRINYQYGYANRKGKLAIKPQFSYAGPFSDDGQAIVELKDRDAVIDRTGQILHTYTPSQRVNLYIKDGVVSFSENNKIGFIDLEGNVLIPAIYEGGDIAIDDENQALMILEGKFGYLNTENEVEIPFIYEELSSFHGDFASMKVMGKWGAINRHGEVIVKPEYDDEFVLSDTTLSLVKKNGLYGYISLDGKVVISPEFPEAFPFRGEVAAVLSEGKWGFIDVSGDFIIPPRFDAVTSFFPNNLAIVEINQKQGVLHKNGLLRTQVQYDYIQHMGMGIWRVERDGQHSFINDKDNVIFKVEETCGEMTLIDDKGQVVWPGKSMADLCATSFYDLLPN